MPSGIIAITVAEDEDGYPRYEVHVDPRADMSVTVLRRLWPAEGWGPMDDWPAMLLPFIMEVLASDEVRAYQARRAPRFVFDEGSVEGAAHIGGTIHGSVPRLRNLYDRYLIQPSVEVASEIQEVVDDLLSGEGVDLRATIRGLLVTAIVQVEPLPPGVDLSAAEQELWNILSGTNEVEPDL